MIIILTISLILSLLFTWDNTCHGSNLNLPKDFAYLINPLNLLLGFESFFFCVIVLSFLLQLLETCVKNCGKRFHLQVANKEFLHDLIKIIGPKNDPPPVVQEKVLSLIQVSLKISLLLIIYSIFCY